MRLRLGDDDLRFRDEIRAFLDREMPRDIRQRMIEDPALIKEDTNAWVKILHRQGWVAPHWPVEFGGTGWSPLRQCIFVQETQRYPAPQPLAFNTNMVGPVICRFGTDAQRRRFLPRLLSHEDWWCQGFSEPNAGSDLAAISTRAVPDGDHYVVNGQKIWTSYAHFADWIFCLVRTAVDGKKQGGISFLLIDMRTPGVEVRPIKLIGGVREVNEVFFTDVRVPVENRIGEENRGWDYAKYLLGNERTNIARVGLSQQRVRRIRQLASIERCGGRALIEDPGFRRELAALEIELKALEITQLRAVAAEGSRAAADGSASILKIVGSEVEQKATALLMKVMGAGAALPEPGPDEATTLAPAVAGIAAGDYFNHRKVSIYGGSNEIQHNIIARAVFGF